MGLRWLGRWVQLGITDIFWVEGRLGTVDGTDEWGFIFGDEAS